MALAAFALARGEPLAFARGLLCNERSLFVLGERSGDLPHHLARGIATVGQVLIQTPDAGQGGVPIGVFPRFFGNVPKRVITIHESENGSRDSGLF